MSAALLAGPFSGAGLAEVESEGAGAADRVAVPGKVARYVDSVFADRDLNNDGMLSEDEWRSMTGEPQSIDRDHDGLISHGEYQTHVLSYGRARTPIREPAPVDGVPSLTAGGIAASSPSPDGAAVLTPLPDPTTGAGETNPAQPAARTTRFTVRPSRGLGNLPGWFLSRDGDGDGQLTLKEFVGASAGDSREFDRLDRNGDGVVTPRELTAPRDAGQPVNP